MPDPTRRLPPLHPTTPSPSTPASALRSLLHTRLALDLTDGRILTGNLLAIDDSAALLLSLVSETRDLGNTEQGWNVARYYPFSREADVSWSEKPQQPQEPGARVRVRELASVLVPIAHVRSVRIVDAADARAWAGCAGVEVVDGVAVPGSGGVGPGTRTETHADEDKMRVVR